MVFGVGDPPCPDDSICSGKARTFVGKKTKTVGGNRTQIINPGTGIYHSSATKINPDGTSTTDVYIISDGKWQKAATTTNGGKTYSFLKDDKGEDVAGAGFQNELKSPQGGVHKNIDTGVNKAADNAGVSATTKEKLLDSNKNKAVNDNSESNTKPAAPDALEATAVNRDDTRTKFPKDLKYPLNLADTKQDIIKFDLHEYVPSTTTRGAGSQFGFSSGSENLGPSIGSVVLPIPSGISDQNKAEWGSNSMTALDVAKADAARAAILSRLSAGAEVVADYIDTVSYTHLTLPTILLV